MTKTQSLNRAITFGKILGAVSLILAASATPALAVHKHHPANNAICFDPALSKEDTSACKKEMGAQTTADGRATVRKTFKRKIAQAKAASAAPVPPIPAVPPAK